MTLHSETQVIDARLRPPFLHRFFGAVPDSAEGRAVRWMNRRLGAENPDHFAAVTGMQTLLGGMDDAGIARGVVVARSTPTVRISNDAVCALVQEGQGRLIGVASVDPLDLGTDGAVAEARRAVSELGLAGVNLDAGFYAQALRADDARLLPLYDLCQQLGVPAFVMSGPTTPDLAYNDPLAVDSVARDFPRLRIVCCHGFYPRIDDMLAVAFRHENVFVSPDMYVFAPGGLRYIEAARGFLADQLLFGTSFPFRPMRQSVTEFAALPLDPTIRAKVMGGNASRLLGLSSDNPATPLG